VVTLFVKSIGYRIGNPITIHTIGVYTHSTGIKRKSFRGISRFEVVF
jgi:hypothetical protein